MNFVSKKLLAAVALLAIVMPAQADVCETQNYSVKAVNSSSIEYVHNQTGNRYSLKLPIYVSGKVDLACSREGIKMLAANHQTGLHWAGKQLDAPRLYFLTINLRNPQRPLIRALEGLDEPKDIAGL